MDDENPENEGNPEDIREDAVEKLAKSLGKDKEEIMRKLSNPSSKTLGGLHTRNALQTAQEHIEAPEHYEVKIWPEHPDDHHLQLRARKLEYDRKNQEWKDLHNQENRERLREAGRKEGLQKAIEIVRKEKKTDLPTATAGRVPADKIIESLEEEMAEE